MQGLVTAGSQLEQVVSGLADVPGLAEIPEYQMLVQLATGINQGAQQLGGGLGSLPTQVQDLSNALNQLATGATNLNQGIGSAVLVVAT